MSTLAWMATLITVLVVAAGFRLFQLRSRYLRVGWAVIPSARHALLYRERANGADRQFELDGDTAAEGRVLYVPSEKEWNSKVPSWAANRRSEILERIKSTAIGQAFKFGAGGA